MSSASGRKAHRSEAFTLIEIMIVVTIIGVLLAVAVPQMLVARESSRAKACIGNLKQIDTAKQEWMMDRKASGIAGETWLPSGPISDPAGLIGTYIRTEPRCPEGGTYKTNGGTSLPTCSLGSNLQRGVYYPHALT